MATNSVKMLGKEIKAALLEFSGVREVTWKAHVTYCSSEHVPCICQPFP